MPNPLTHDTVLDLQKRVYALLDSHPGSYDWHHIRNVAKYSLDLAYRRQMNPDIALACALLHDHGRIVSGVVGKRHAEEGAAVALLWLAPYDLPQEDLDLILSSIHCHNQKKNLHHPYAELLKDADSLAHNDEFQGEISLFESLRVQDALLPDLTVTLGSKSAIRESLNNRLSEQDYRLKKLIKSGLSSKRVHNYRINVRQLRAILWLGREDQWQKDSKKLNRTLKDSFKGFEYPRQLSVLRKTLKKIDIDPAVLSTIDQEIALHETKLIPQLKESRKALKNCRVPDLTIKRRTIKRKLAGYLILLEVADIKNIESLHNLRIYGKRIKYLVEENILTLGSREDYELLDDMHKTLGRLNDIPENRKLLGLLSQQEPYAGLLDAKDRIEEHFLQEEKNIKKEVKRLLFRARKRWMML